MSQQVVGILITHWHLDHIEGASKLLKACSNAKLYLSGALFTREALQIASLYKKDVFAETDKDIREFGEIIQFLHETEDRNRIVPVKTRHTFFDYRETIPTRLIALSPSDVAVTQSISKLAQFAKKPGDQRIRTVVPESENLNAVAVHFSFGSFSALVGSDLEETGNVQTGWSAIFEDNIINELSLSASSLFKVPHHGSETGHHDRIWEDLLIEKPLSMTTPFSRCDLPTPKNIERLKQLSSNLLIARDPRARNRIKRDNMVERELRSIAIARKSINDKMGHIRVRVSDKGAFDISVNQNVVKF